MSKLFQWIGMAVVAIAGICGVAYALFRWLIPDPPKVPEFGHFEIDGKPAIKLVQVFGAPGAAPFAKEENWTPTDWDAKLGHNLTYVDPGSLRWDVPAGQINDGASVPKILHSFVEGGHNGRFLGAAIVHDCFCQKEEARKQLGVDFPKVHRMFYYAMRASDVPEDTAKVMYAAVCCFGPPGSPDQWIRALFAWDPEDGKRAREQNPDWTGWTDERSAAASSQVAKLETSLKATRLDLQDVQAKSEEAQRHFQLASARVREMHSMEEDAAAANLDDSAMEDLLRLADEAKNLRIRSVALEKTRDASEQELEGAKGELAKAREEESRAKAVAGKFLSLIQEGHQNLSLEEIEAKARETARTLSEAP